jgi:hypothetical protein
VSVRAHARSCLPADVLAGLCPPRVFVLATASAGGVPATTSISWLTPRDEHRLVLALDRRGLAYQNVLENPQAALEVTIGEFAATLRGRLCLLCEQLERAPFPCAAFLFDVEEIRDHAAPGIVLEPATYSFSRAKNHYRTRQDEIAAELASLVL